jgi:sugar phosphate isomerase/epimerase
MSLVDEVLVNHSDNAGSTFCYWCDGEWPCESVRLALSLRAAEQVVEAAREMLSESFIVGGGRRGGKTLFAERWAKCADALAEYDKGGQG